MIKLYALLQSFRKDEDGATAIEYGLIAAGISLAILAAVVAFGGDLEALFGELSGALDTAGG